MNYVWLGLFGMGVGMLSGLLGIGGGIALVPGLVFVFGYSQPEAQGTSLAVLSLPVVIFAAVVYYQHDFIRLPVVGWLALGFVVGAYLGALLVPSIPQAWLKTGFGVLLLYVGFTFILTPTATRPAAMLPAGIATLFTWLIGRWLRGWQTLAAVKPPPGEDMEYHI